MGNLFLLFKRSFQSFGRDKCATFSAAIAYYTVFSLFPLALLGVSILGFFVGDESARDSVISGFTNVMSLDESGQEALAGTLEGVSSQKGWIGLVGILTAAWSASGLFGAIRTALDRIWDVDRPLPMIRAKLRDLMLLAGFGGLIGLSATSTGLLQGARAADVSWLGPVVELAPPVFAILLIVVPLLLSFFAFCFLYRFAPHARLSFGSIVPAAIIGALFFEFGKNILAFYLTRFGNYNALAGSLGAAILFLVFIYYTSQVLLLAAEFAKHRLLIKAGAVPAADPKVVKPKVPLGERVKKILYRLWNVDEVHHDPELPYQPARMDPVTNQPANTKEAVLLAQEQAVEQAVEEGGRVKDAPKPTQQPAHFIMIDGAGRPLVGTRQQLRPRQKDEDDDTMPVVAVANDVVVTRNGRPATLAEIGPADRITMQLNEKGEARRIDAAVSLDTSVETMRLLSLGIGVLMDWRSGRADAKREKEKKRRRDEDKQHLKLLQEREKLQRRSFPGHSGNGHRNGRGKTRKEQERERERLRDSFPS